jgi:hypothetical protein
MNIEETKEAIRIMQAFVDGKEVEFHCRDGWKQTDIPQWQFGATKYRIKPTTVLRPWTPDEVPLGAWGRNPKYPKTRWLIDRTSSEENRMDWYKNYEHSTDGGKTWSACGVVEEAK